jgi:hypothetical protein
MAIGEALLKKINRKFEPSSTIRLRHGRHDLALKTDEQGNGILLFLGREAEDGTIHGDRYARTLKYDREGKLIKDHWERKGKAG